MLRLTADNFLIQVKIGMKFWACKISDKIKLADFGQFIVKAEVQSILFT